VSSDVQRLGEYINGADGTATFSSLRERIGLDAEGHYVAVSPEEGT
jgi:hypothetical protein